MARIDHNVEEFDCRYCNSQDQYKMRPDDFSPDKLIRNLRCSTFCLPSSAHSLKNENKLSMEISCQLFWNKQYKLLNNYVKLTWERIGGVSTRTKIEGLSYAIVGSPRSMMTSNPHENHTSCKVLPNSGNQNGLRSQNCTDLLQNPYHDGSLGEFSLFPYFHGLQNPSSPRHSVLQSMG